MTTSTCVHVLMLAGICVLAVTMPGAAQPSAVTSAELGREARLVVTADLHSMDGGSSLRDLAYVSTDDNGRAVLSILLNNGAGGLEPPPGSKPLLAGANPQLLAAARLRRASQDRVQAPCVPPEDERPPDGTPTGPRDEPTDLALVDQPSSGPPILRIFTGTGRGRFVVGSELLLALSSMPTSIVAARFRGPTMPMDLALVGPTTVTVLFNDGTGKFTGTKVETSLPMRAGTVAVSTALRKGQQADLLIRDADANRILYLVNIGGGNFRPASLGRGFVDAAGNVDSLLIGDLTCDGLDDLVTFDRDTTLRVFVNDPPSAPEGFIPLKEANPLGSDGKRVLVPTYALAKFEGERLGLVAPTISRTVTAEGVEVQEALTFLTGDGTGKFTLSPRSTPIVAGTIGSKPSASPKTEFQMDPVVRPVPEFPTGQRIVALVAGLFRNAEIGNGKDDVALLTSVSTESVEPNACEGQPGVPPQPRTVCPEFEKCGLDKLCQLTEECCNCRSGPKQFQCSNWCNSPRPTVRLCRTTRRYQMAVIYANAGPG